MTQAMKALGATLLAAALSIPVTAGGVDPALLALAPPDSKILVGIQVSQALTSPFGRFLINQVQLDSDYNKEMTAMGFDPRRDLQEIVAASGAGFNNGVLIGRGTFHPDKLSAAGVAAGGTRSTYRGVSMIESQGAVAFLDASTILIGDAASVKATIDRHAVGTALAGALSARARLISAANDAWLVTIVPPAGTAGNSPLNPQLGPFASVLQAATQLSAGVKFTDANVTLSADVLTRSAQDAQSMTDLLKLAVSMLKSAGEQGQGGKQSPGASMFLRCANLPQRPGCTPGASDG